MDRTLSVRTPESIAFRYDLAGLGSRFLAVTIDFTIQILITLAIVAGFALLAQTFKAVKHTGSAYSVSSGWPESLTIALVSALVFAIFFGYFILFEAFWSGRTPGKRMMGLRVVRDGGYPIDFTSSLIRNLIRVGEVALGAYALSAIACLASKENKRLGDVAAGTIVVRDSRAASLAALIGEAQNEREPIPGVSLGENERSVIDRFLLRAPDLTPAVRSRIAMRLADRIKPRVPPELRELDDEELLRRLSAS